MEAKAELIAMIGQMTDDQAGRLLDFVNNLNDPDTLTDEEMADVLEGLAEYERGETITLEKVKLKYGL